MGEVSASNNTNVDDREACDSARHPICIIPPSKVLAHCSREPKSVQFVKEISQQVTQLR